MPKNFLGSLGWKSILIATQLVIQPIKAEISGTRMMTQIFMMKT